MAMNLKPLGDRLVVEPVSYTHLALLSGELIVDGAQKLIFGGPHGRVEQPLSLIHILPPVARR